MSPILECANIAMTGSESAEFQQMVIAFAGLMGLKP